MVKIKKLKRLGLALIVAAVAATPFLLQKDSEAATTSYKDFSQIPTTYSSDWSRARIHYTNNTSITVKQVGRSESGDPGTGAMAYEAMYHVNPNNTLVILIENSTAKDSSGNPADVIMRVDIVRESSAYVQGSTRDLYVWRRKYICGSSATNPASCSGTLGEGSEELGVGDPIIFGIETRFDTADVTVQYIKKGTFNSSTMSGTPAGISKMSYAVFDFDVPAQGRPVNYDDPNSQIMLDGHEAIFAPTYEPSSTTYYYNKNNPSGAPAMYEKDRGLGVSDLPAGYNAGFNGIYWGSSTYATAEGMQSSSYKFSYCGTEAGVYFFFGSPIPNETASPAKFIESGSSLVKTNRVTTNTQFNYVITQDTPADTKGKNDILTYMSLWSKYDNIVKSRNYSSFTITDTLNANLTPVGASAIKVYRGNTDVTSNFTASINGQKVTISAKSDYVVSDAFYDTSFRFVIPVKVNATVNATTVTNQATREYCHMANDTTPSCKSNNTDTVTTTLYHKLTVKHIDILTGQQFVDPVTTEHNHGYNYTTSQLTPAQLPSTNYRLTEMPTNATGTLNEDTTVTYYYILTHKLTVNHYDVQTSELIVDPRISTHDHGYKYDTDPLQEDEFPGEQAYSLVAYPLNKSGTLTSDMIVNYYYLRKYKLTVKHIDDQTGEDLVEPTISKHEYEDTYETSALTPEQLPAGEDYRLVATPDNASGKITENTTVIYRYVRYRKLTVKHIDEETEEEIVAPVTSEHERGYEYTTNPLEEFPDDAIYELVETPGNAKGTLNDDTTVTYYYKRSFRLTVKYLEQGTDKELDETITSVHPRGYEYETEKSDNIPAGYVLVAIPSNATGVLDQDTVVIYYYNIPPIPVPVTLDNSVTPLFVAFGALASGSLAAFYFISKRR